MYKKINIDLSDSQVDKLKHAVKNGVSTTLRLDKKMISSSGQHELFLTNTQINKIANSIGAADIKLSKTQLKELIQRGGFLGSLLGKLAGPLMGLAKNVLLPLGLTAAASAADAGIQKKILGGNMYVPNSGKKYKLCINSDELGDILQIIEALEQSGLLIDGITETVMDKVQNQEGGFLGLLLGTLGASLLSNLLSKGKGTVRAGEGIRRAGKGFMRAGEGIRRAGEGFMRAGEYS